MKRGIRKWSGVPSREKAAYRRLVQDIHRRGLRCGDKLPSQQELRHELGFSNSSLSAAMAHLVADGVVERNTRPGTLVVDPEAADLSAWTVALLLNWDMGLVPSPFYSQVTCLLQQGVVAAGCHCRAYSRTHRPSSGPDSLECYLGLLEDIEGGLVDAIVTPGYFDSRYRDMLAERNIPVSFSSPSRWAWCGSVIDFAGFAREAVGHLYKMGRRRFGTLTGDTDGTLAYFRDAARTVVSNLPDATYESMNTIPSGIDSGREAAGLLLGRPAHERPDGLIVGDDIVAMALAQVLRLESDYAPAIATITHQAAPLTFALPVLHFELNDAVFASTAVRMLTDRLCDPDLPDRVELIAPRLIDEDAAHMSWAGHCEAKTQPSHGMVE